MTDASSIAEFETLDQLVEQLGAIPLERIRLRPAPGTATEADLLVEVLSRGNTAAEMRRKVQEYFRAGVRLVWLVDLARKTARCHTSVDQFVDLADDDELPVLDLLPGFHLTLKSWMQRAELPGVSSG